MPSSSESQRRLFGAVLAYKRGKMKNASPKIKKVSGGISEGDAEDFATKKKRQRVSKSLMTGKSGY